jgi:UDP-3-O-[3-hydroxymyristoyl] glucosamine N-acyltransferase
LLGTDVVRVQGRLDRRIRTVAALGSANEDAITFCRHDDHRLDSAAKSNAAAVIVPSGRIIRESERGPTLIAVKNPRLAFIKVSRHLFTRPVEPQVHPTAIVHPTASIDPTAHVGPFVVVGPRCSVGRGSSLGPHVVLQQDVRIGANCRIDAGTVIGGEGFGFERDENGELINFPHIGGVVIGDNVDIGCNTCIDRGALENTVIKDGARIDNLAHISHNCSVGAHAVVVCNVTLCGSSTVGDYAWISPNASVLNQRTVGKHAFVGMGAVVVKDVEEGKVVVGNPAKVLPPR